MRASISRRSTLSCIETRGKRHRFGIGLRQQTSNADRHVIESSGRIQTRTDGEAEIGGGERAHRAFADFEQRANARHRAPRTNAPDALRHQHAVVHIERHEIRDRAERHQIEKIRDRRHHHHATRIDLATHGGHHVEGDAHARERARAEAAAGNVGIHDHVRVGQRRSGQMVIRDQHLDAARTRRGDSGNARDAVVDGDDERRPPFRGEPDDLWREPVAELETVGHQEIHGRESPGAQTAHDERRAGRAVRVEVPDDEDASLAMLEDEGDGRIDAVERAYRHESVEREREVLAVANTTRRVSAPQDRMQREIGDFVAARRASFDDQFHGSGFYRLRSRVLRARGGVGARISIADARRS